MFELVVQFPPYSVHFLYGSLPVVFAIIPLFDITCLLSPSCFLHSGVSTITTTMQIKTVLLFRVIILVTRAGRGDDAGLWNEGCQCKMGHKSNNITWNRWTGHGPTNERILLNKIKEGGKGSKVGGSTGVNQWKNKKHWGGGGVQTPRVFVGRGGVDPPSN